MFGHKKEKEDSIKSVYNEQLPDTKSIDIDSIPVHTLRSDFEDLNSEAAPKNIPVVPKVVPKKEKEKEKEKEPDHHQEPPKKQEPALSYETPRSEKETSQKEPVISNESSKETPFSYSPENTFKKMYETKSAINDIGLEEMGMEIESERKSWIGKIFNFLFIVMLIAAIGGGGYYFWKTRVENMSSENMQKIDNQTGQNKIFDESPEEPIFSMKSANYLSIDPGTLDENSLKQKLSDAAIQLKSEQPESKGPVEFILTDQNNVPLTFSDFSQKIGLALPQSVLSQLNETFFVYLYIDNNSPRVGMSISSKSDPLLQAAVSNEEKSLAKDLKPIFLEDAYTIQENYTFKTSTYNNQPIRYTNIISPVELSIDYTIANSKFTIGTTKQTLRSILDYAAQKSDSSEVGV